MNPDKENNVGVIDKEPITFVTEGLRVLAVDDDSTHLRVLTKMLQTCHYKVTKCKQAAKAISLLQNSKSLFDIVISDVHMPDMDGLQFIEIINSLEMDLPVVIISAEDRADVALKFVIQGACAYIHKPVQMEDVRFLWQHVVRRQMMQSKPLQQLNNFENISELTASVSNNEDQTSLADKENCGRSNGEKDQVEEEGKDGDRTVEVKKPRLVWTDELHQHFLAAVKQIGYRNAVPKRILEIMNVPGLSRENVASHLQKYRLHLRRESENLQHRSKFSLPQGQVHPKYSSPTHTILDSSNLLTHATHETSPTGQANTEISSAVLGSGIPLFDQTHYYGLVEQSLTIDDDDYVARGSSSQEIPSITQAEQAMPLNQYVPDVGTVNVKNTDGETSSFSDPNSSFCGNNDSSCMMEGIQNIAKKQRLNEFPEHDFSSENTPTASFTSNRNHEYNSDSSYQHQHFFQEDGLYINPFDEFYTGQI